MPSDADGSPTISTLGASARTIVSVRNAVMVIAGLLAGASLVFLGKEAVVVPVIGPTPGILVGAIGLVTALAISQRGSCCDNCGSKECGCSGDCGDSCSYDP